MKLILIKPFLFLVIILSTFIVTAQNTNKKIKTIYSYTFNAEMNTSSIYNMEEEVKALKNVTEVKIKYKAEKKNALLIVVVKEAKRIKESDVLFQPINLKKIISKNGFTPDELTTETFSK
ncbi:MAG: hypothetical protein HRT73_02225 [Flavobacteriales bacterium]|nr:hypothetical protein [Flavobacteriales bacterium]NQX96682.1 hypothetical protein [Flavobacteriales bacterium]